MSHLNAILLVAGLALTIPSTLPAATFTPPAGCRLEATVQNRSCTVTQLYRCDSDPEGDQRSAVFSKDGLTHLSRIDRETRWLESSNPSNGIADRLVKQARDHASFSTLLETGRDDFDFWTESNTGERLHHQGFDLLTGKTVSIGGVDLEETRFELTTTNEAGEVLITRHGQQFISRSFGRFFGGIEEQSDWTGQTLDINDSPVLFRFPGQTGFGSTTPQFDCNQLITQLYRKEGARL